VFAAEEVATFMAQVTKAAMEERSSRLVRTQGLFLVFFFKIV
jgi:hypothetical protein